jgi:hypothetical protein
MWSTKSPALGRGPGRRPSAEPGGRRSRSRMLGGAALATAMLSGTLAFAFGPGEPSPVPVPPGPPTGLAALASGASQVGLSWTAPVSDGGLPVFGYDVYDGTSSAAVSTLVPDSPVPGTSYTVSGLASGVTYYFDVTAVNRAGQSLPSNQAHAAGITVRVRGSQTIRFGSLASRVAGARFRLSATASSGLPVSFRSDTPRVCTVSGSTVRTAAAGRCAIRAAQAGNADYQPAADVTQSFTVGQRTGTGTGTETGTGTGTGSGAGRVLLLIAALAAVILVIAAASLVVRQLRLRDRPPVPPPPNVRAEPHGGPPAVVSVQDTGTDKTHSLRIEPHAGASVTTIEELRP